MDSRRILDEALDSLDMLSTVTNARKEYLTEMKMKGIMSVNFGTGYGRRYEEGSQSCGLTKENFSNRIEKTMLYCTAGPSKICFRSPKYRPYDISKRKPLNNLVNPVSKCGISEGFGNISMRSRSSDSYSESRNSRDIFDALVMPDDEISNCHPRDALNYYSKTEKFPIPLLSRSKSLEDLRNSPNKSRSKQVRFQLFHCDDNSNGAASSNGSNESPLSASPGTSFLNVLKGEASIKNEIDTMSVLIEKLDVA